MNNFDKDLRTVWQVVDALIDRGDAVTVNKVNGVDEVNGVDVDYSQCPNCVQHEETYVKLNAANVDAVTKGNDALKRCSDLEKELEEARQNGGSDENCEGLKEQLEAQKDTITGKTTRIEGMEKTISDLTKDNDRLKDKNHKEIAHRDNEESQVHMTGGQ
ncbi:hypothetical protein KAR91_11030 [Candidatus Pacearchaeota archaeon]|nr:hypothetical protein [Candidatus Pacearchaeota archaeon]